MDHNYIKKFLEFEKNSGVEKILYKGENIWPIIRNSSYIYILKKKGVMQIPGTPGQKKYKNKSPLYLILKSITNIFNLLGKFYRRWDLIVLNYERKILIDGSNQNLLVWTIRSCIKKNKILVLDTAGINLNDKNAVDISYLLKILRFIYGFNKNNEWIKYSNNVNKKIREYYGLEINFSAIYVDTYVHQKLIKNFTKIFFIFNKPKAVIFSQEGSFPFLTRELNRRKIISIDFQHGMQSGSIPIFKYNDDITSEQKKYIPQYTFIFGEFWRKKYNYCKNVVAVGNLYHEKMSEIVSNIRKEENSILIVSDGLLARDKLIKLAISISKNLIGIKIYYKLRPEEYKNASIDYKLLYEQKNIQVISSDESYLYEFIKKSNYVIGINSTVLIESNRFSNIIVYKTGWSFEMNDFTNSGNFLLADNPRTVEEIIKNKIESKSKIRNDLIFKKNPKENIRLNLEKLI